MLFCIDLYRFKLICVKKKTPDVKFEILSEVIHKFRVYRIWGIRYIISKFNRAAAAKRNIIDFLILFSAPSLFLATVIISIVAIEIVKINADPTAATIAGAVTNEIANISESIVAPRPASIIEAIIGKVIESFFASIKIVANKIITAAIFVWELFSMPLVEMQTATVVAKTIIVATTWVISNFFILPSFGFRKVENIMRVFHIAV